MRTGIGPPSNEEIDITSTTTTIGGNAYIGDTNTSVRLSPDAYGPISLFKLNYDDGTGQGFNKTIDVTGIRLPFAAGTLEVKMNSASSVNVRGVTYYYAKWTLGTTVITAAAPQTRDWPPGLAIPSTSGTFQYQTTLDGSWTPSTGSSMTLFGRMKFQTFTGSPT